MTGWAACRWVKPGITVSACASACASSAALQRPRAGRRSGRIASRTQSRKSVATWSLRERAVCSRRPGSPISSVQPRLDVQVDVLERVAEREARRLDLAPRSASRPVRIASRSALREMPAVASIAACAAEPAMSCAPQPLVEADRGVDLLHEGRRPALEMPAPQIDPPRPRAPPPGVAHGAARQALAEDRSRPGLEGTGRAHD